MQLRCISECAVDVGGERLTVLERHCLYLGMGMEVLVRVRFIAGGMGIVLSSTCECKRENGKYAASVLILRWSRTSFEDLQC